MRARREDVRLRVPLPGLWHRGVRREARRAVLRQVSNDPAEVEMNRDEVRIKVRDELIYVWAAFLPMDLAEQMVDKLIDSVIGMEPGK